MSEIDEGPWPSHSAPRFTRLELALITACGRNGPELGAKAQLIQKLLGLTEQRLLDYRNRFLEAQQDAELYSQEVVRARTYQELLHAVAAGLLADPDAVAALNALPGGKGQHFIDALERGLDELLGEDALTLISQLRELIGRAREALRRAADAGAEVPATLLDDLAEQAATDGFEELVGQRQFAQHSLEEIEQTVEAALDRQAVPGPDGLAAAEAEAGRLRAALQDVRTLATDVLDQRGWGTRHLRLVQAERVCLALEVTLQGESGRRPGRKSGAGESTQPDAVSPAKAGLSSEVARMLRGPIEALRGWRMVVDGLARTPRH